VKPNPYDAPNENGRDAKSHRLPILVFVFIAVVVVTIAVFIWLAILGNSGR
jgi:hypothetical protein